MKNRFIYLILAGAALLTSCYKEDPITPSDAPMIANRFEFPQGDAEWDRFAEEIHDQYGVYLIYKDIDSMDLNRSWYSLNGNNSGEGLTDQQAEAHMNFMRDHIFRYLNPSAIKGVFKPFYYLVYNFYGYSAANYGNAFLLNYTSGIDFWVSSILNDNNPTFPTDPKKLKEYRVRTLMQILPEAYNKGKITEPDGFFDKFDFKTAIVTGSYQLDDPNHYWKRGFPGVPVVVTATEAEHFKLTAEKLSAAITPRTKAILLNNPTNPTGMMYDREELEAKFPSADYPLIHTCRNMVADHLKNAYGIDLEAIEHGPQE